MQHAINICQERTLVVAQLVIPDHFVRQLQTTVQVPRVKMVEHVALL